MLRPGFMLPSHVLGAPPPHGNGVASAVATSWLPARPDLPAAKRQFWARFYSSRTRTLETCIRLIAGVELLTWVCQLAVCADAMLLDKMMK